MEEVDKSLNEVMSELKSIREDEELQKLMDVKELADKPSVFSHSMADIIRELNISDEIKKESEEPLIEEEKTVEPTEQVSKTRLKSARRSVRPPKPMRISSMPKSSSLNLKKHSSRESRTTRGSQATRVSQATSRKSKMVDSGMYIISYYSCFKTSL